MEKTTSLENEMWNEFIIRQKISTSDEIHICQNSNFDRRNENFCENFLLRLSSLTHDNMITLFCNWFKIWLNLIIWLKRFCVYAIKHFILNEIQWLSYRIWIQCTCLIVFNDFYKFHKKKCSRQNVFQKHNEKKRKKLNHVWNAKIDQIITNDHLFAQNDVQIFMKY